MDGQKQRHPSGGVSVSTEMVLGMEGVELGADGKVRKSFFLLVCNADPWCGVMGGQLAAFTSVTV